MSGYDNTSNTVRNIVASATAATLTNNDYVLIVTGGATAQAVSVAGAANAIPGRQYTVINASGGTTTITPLVGTIDGGASLAVPTSTAVTIVADGAGGTNWYVMSNGS